VNNAPDRNIEKKKNRKRTLRSPAKASKRALLIDQSVEERRRKTKDVRRKSSSRLHYKTPVHRGKGKNGKKTGGEQSSNW